MLFIPLYVATVRDIDTYWRAGRQTVMTTLKKSDSHENVQTITTGES